jgi:hypothetical protein
LEYQSCYQGWVRDIFLSSVHGVVPKNFRNQIINSYSTNSSRIWADSRIGYRSYSTRVSGITACFIIYTHGLNSQTLLFGYFQYFSILFMFLSSLFRPIIFSNIYIF